jgi:hypothetical protein
MAARDAERMRKCVLQAPVPGWEVEFEVVEEVAKHSYGYRPVRGSPCCTIKRRKVSGIFQALLYQVAEDCDVWLRQCDPEAPEFPSDDEDKEAAEEYKDYVPQGIRDALKHFKEEWQPRRTYQFYSEVEHSENRQPLFTVTIRPVRLVLCWEAI